MTDLTATIYPPPSKTPDELRADVARLQSQLQAAVEALRGIRAGYGNPNCCRRCGALRFFGDVPLPHADDCPVTTAEAALRAIDGAGEGSAHAA